MIKNRIWKRIAALGCCLLTGIGLLGSCMAKTVAAAADMGNIAVTVSQSASWTDLKNFQAIISVKAEGLGNLSWKEWEEIGSSENKEEEKSGFQSYESEDILKIEAISDEMTSGIISRHLTILLSEYFQPDFPTSLPEGCLMEEFPVNTADGRSTTIYSFRYKIHPGETEKKLEIPVSLRSEYRYPMEKRTVSTCQDAPLEKSVENLCEGGVYIVEKSGSSQRVICQTMSELLEIPAGTADFAVEVRQQKENAVSGERILMNARLINTGQVPLYKLSLEAQAEEPEAAPV